MGRLITFLQFRLSAIDLKLNENMEKMHLLCEQLERLRAISHGRPKTERDTVSDSKPNHRKQ